MDNGAGGFSSPRTTTAADAFPAGLRVLVVDDDPTWLKILEKMLKKCSYEVTTCSLAREALNVLRERKDGFDIVISDVNMPDMDGFKLLEHVGLEMDLPVIMMSVDGETSRVMKGVQHGACDYLTKPVRMKELKNIWQHVLRKKIHEVKDTESYEASEDIQMMRNGSDKFDDGLLFGGGDVSSVKKRKDMESKENDDQDFNDPSALKRARVVWSVDLHQKFVNAVDQIGLDKIGPKKILDLMNVPWLTRENVASHLQKYRLYLSRIQKQNEPKTSCGGTKQQDFIPNDAQAGFDLPCSVKVHQENVASCNFGYSGNKLFVQDMNSNFEEGDLKSIVSFSPRIESRKALTGELPQKRSSGSRTGLGHSLGSLGMDTRYTSFESTIPPQHSWNKEIRMMQFSQPPKQESELHGHTHLPHSGPQHHIQPERLVLAPSIPHRSSGPQHHIQPDCIELASSVPHRSSGPQQRIQPDCIGGLAPSIPHGSSGPLHLIQPDRVGLAPSISHGSATTKREKMSSAGTKTLRSEYISNSARNISSRGHTNNPFSTHYETEVLNPQGFGPNTISTGSSSMKHPSLDQKSTSNWISDSQNLSLGSGSTLQSSQEVLQLCALQDYDSIQNVGLSHIEHLDYHDLELFEGLPGQSYDRMRLNCDYLCDSMEYPIMDQGLFIV